MSLTGWAVAQLGLIGYIAIGLSVAVVVLTFAFLVIRLKDKNGRIELRFGRFLQYTHDWPPPVDPPPGGRGVDKVTHS